MTAIDSVITEIEFLAVHVYCPNSDESAFWIVKNSATGLTWAIDALDEKGLPSTLLHWSEGEGSPAVTLHSRVIVSPFLMVWSPPGLITIIGRVSGCTTEKNN